MAQQLETVMGLTEEANTSLEHIMASELYPKKPLTADDDNLQVPFPILPGESVEYLGKTDSGIIALSNFRLFIRFKEAFINIPLGLIETVEYRDIFFINIYCKDAHSLRCTFATNETCLDWYKRLTAAIQLPKKLQDVFAFAFHAWCKDQSCGGMGAALEHSLAYQLCKTEDAGGGYSFGKEVERMGFDLKTAWRICYINEDYKVCPSYPKQHLVPACMTDKDIKAVANFRASHRFPSVVWRDQRTGAVIVRCSQPEVGWLGWRNVEDERLLQAISAACALNAETTSPGTAFINGHGGENPSLSGKEPQKMLIIDARSYAAAWANRAKGGGCECPEYYPNCEIQFMSLANIHTVRKSFYAVRALCALGPDQPNWLTSVENTKWLSHIGLLMRSAVLVVNAVHKERRPVLVHCSDGWDRTPQIVALAEIMLDPFYRTIEGFRILVEREWLALGHKFADRCGNAIACEDINERCPVFVQWLDCIRQLQLQFPCAFQFNEAFLVKLAHHTYSSLFGTFLCNNIREREEGKIPAQTSSAWSLLVASDRTFVNILYKADIDQVLRPSCQMRHLQLWQAVYMSETAPTSVEEIFDTQDEDDGTEILAEVGPEQIPLTKTRSCDDIPSAIEHGCDSSPVLPRARRLSDPHIATDPNSLLQSTDSLTASITSDRKPDDKNKDITNGEHCENTISEQISNCVSSETLTEIQGTVSEEVLVGCGETSVGEEVLTGCGEAHEDKDLEASMGNGKKENEEGEEDCDNSQYGIARIDSPQAETAQESVANTHFTRTHELLGHVNGSTDTLTGDNAETSVINDDDTGPDLNLKNSSKSTSSNSSHAISGKASVYKKDKSEAITMCNGHITNGYKGDNITSKSANGHVRHKINGNECQPFRMEDVLSRLNIESLLDVGSLKRDGIDMCPFMPSMSRGSSSGRDDAADGSSSSCVSRTPNSSTGPPTPGTELKSGPWFQRNQSSLGRHLDCDGLTSYADPIQSRMSQIESDYQQKIQQLEHQLHMAKALIYQYATGNNGASKLMENPDDMLSNESADSGEHGSLEGGSTAASDVSWEQVEERDAHMTLWVPDHAVTHCAGCDQVFWVVRRKHHCRNCGQVFCGECCQNYTPLPEQHLPNPQRVCNICYKTEGCQPTMADGCLMDAATEDGSLASC